MRKLPVVLSLLVSIAFVGACGDDDPPANSNNQTDAGVDVSDDVGEETGDVAVDIPDFEDVGLVINEVAAAGEPSDWFEIYNGTAETIDLSTWRFTDSVADRPAGAPFAAGSTIAPGQYLQVTVDDDYPGFKLGGDEELAVFDAGGRVVDQVDWDEGQSPVGGSFGRIPDLRGAFKILVAPTPAAPNVDNPDGAECGNDVEETGEGCDDGNLVDGDGCSSICQQEQLAECGNDVEEAPEECDDGGRENGDGCDENCLVELPLGEVVINEVVSLVEGGEDWIELTNRGAAEVDLEGWYLTDSDPTHIFVIGATTALAPGAYLVFERRAEGSFEFGLGLEDGVYLYDSSGNLIDRAIWTEGDAPDGASWARDPDAEGPFETLTPPTRGAAN